MKVREVLKILDADGWKCVHIRGSHRIMQHQSKSGIIVVPGNLGDEIPKGTLHAIFKQAQLED